MRPLPFLFPIYKGVQPGSSMNVGLWIYDSLALFRAPRSTRRSAAPRALELEPAAPPDGLARRCSYYDCATDDARLVLENALDARALGAAMHTYTGRLRFVRDGDGRINGVDRARRAHRQARVGRVRAHAVILAAGAWTDEVIRARPDGAARCCAAPRACTSCVAARAAAARPRHRDLAGRRPRDVRDPVARAHRARHDRHRLHGQRRRGAADADDVQYLCETGNGYFPGANLAPDDVIATWAGLRPLIAAPPNVDESEVSREHEVFTRPTGSSSSPAASSRRIAGWRARWSITRERSSSAPGRPSDAIEKLPGQWGSKRRAVETRRAPSAPTEWSTRQVAKHLAGTYGTRAGGVVSGSRDAPAGGAARAETPYLHAQVDVAVEQELARDGRRRARAARADAVARAQPGARRSPRVAARGWPRSSAGARRARDEEVARYRAIVETTRAFRG